MPLNEFKTESHAEVGSVGGDDIKEVTERYGTVADQRDMYRMGKTQKLRVSLLLSFRVLVLMIDS